MDLLIDKFNFVEHIKVSQNDPNANKTLIFANKSTIEGSFLAVHMDIWINCVGLTVRTGTAAVGCVANGVGMLGLAKKLGQSWAKVGARFGRGFGQSWDRKLSQVANGSKLRRLNWGHGQAVAALQNE